MSFKEKFMQTITGKTQVEREGEKAARKDISKKEHEAYLVGKREAAIRYAKKRAEYDEAKKFEKYRQKSQPKNYSMPFGNGGLIGGFAPIGRDNILGGGFGNRQPQVRTVRKRVLIKPKRKQKFKYVTRTVQVRPEPFRVI